MLLGNESPGTGPSSGAIAAGPAKTLSSSLPQPGKKSLMLKMFLGSGGVSPTPTTSLARQRILEKERERAVQAYRTLKKLQQPEMTRV